MTDRQKVAPDNTAVRGSQDGLRPPDNSEEMLVAATGVDQVRLDLGQ